MKLNGVVLTLLQVHLCTILKMENSHQIMHWLIPYRNLAHGNLPGKAALEVTCVIKVLILMSFSVGSKELRRLTTWNTSLKIRLDSCLLDITSLLILTCGKSRVILPQ